MEFDLVTIWSHMTILNKIIIIGLLLMSVFSFYVIGERFLTYRAGAEQNIRYVQALGEHLRTHRVDEALRAARIASKSPVARVMEAGLTALQMGREAHAKDGPHDVGNFDLVDSVNRALERVKERETSNLRKGLGWLGTTASSTPFIGLLGTVIGIIGAFQLLKGGGTIDTVGPAIAEALIATAVGLAVAIIAAMAFNFYTQKVEHFVVDMNDVSSEFIDYVLREGR
ncbi:MAG: MotA/TolQ/ExbB proton channel family protein [Kofleriaceae bacterium]|nr:MotA/TolQ/ExbB proton channel family protein [Kofleriaceae bacterium]MBP6836507.1 MotA/TolQ/ExbB proton channel family protein [Kofleriaceae bacterium]MBP9207527.1 MotA/TolQ/ExbB proton channel family protein [Kofleriaceae bacterium]